ncbi:MAG: hypothetical protein AAF195_03720 [Pseudomonadota bacterium]
MAKTSSTSKAPIAKNSNAYRLKFKKPVNTDEHRQKILGHIFDIIDQNSNYYSRKKIVLCDLFDCMKKVPYDLSDALYHDKKAAAEASKVTKDPRNIHADGRPIAKC